MSARSRAWRDLVASGQLKDLEADLDEAEGRILAELASDPKAPLIARQVEAVRMMAAAEAAEKGAGARVRPAYGPAEAASRVAASVEQTLVIPRRGAAARIVGDQALFGVSLTVDQARALLDAWVDLMEANDDGDDDGAPPAPEVVAISEFLFLLLDPLAEKLSDLP
ncbi:MAG: hypothetical protein QOE93_2185 [Actinomycetota bacterium]|jgi:hypothetical protein|nr:hypothetical protein [Actinomycetota bacterium]